ncbi:SpoIIE family protein phosphatase [bacterium]|nr:SpoIIE family protein phosphatase [bacterium]
MRMKLRRVLEQDIGAEVIVAEDGEQAWEIFQAAEDIQFVISDWVMPLCDGPALCARIRKITDRPYTYFILATAKAEAEDLVEGMASGADDYVCKPINNAELMARVNAGIRVIELERSLAHRTQELERALSAASQMQQGMLPSADILATVKQTHGLNIAYKYQACQSLGGDILGLSEPAEGVLSLILGDVSGHGIPASLAAVGLYTFLHTQASVVNDPRQLMQLAHNYCATEFPTGVYATQVYLHMRPQTREIRAVIAGHPSLVLVRSNGAVEKLEAGMPPLGLFPNLPDDIGVSATTLEPGDRLIAYTDGVVESRNANGEMYSEQHLVEALTSNASDSLPDLIDKVLSEIAAWRGSDLAEDDVTMVALEFTDH